MKWRRTVTNLLLPITLMGTLANPALTDLKLAEGGPTDVFYNTSLAGEGMWVEVQRPVPEVQVEGTSWVPDFDPNDQVITDFGTIERKAMGSEYICPLTLTPLATRSLALVATPACNENPATSPGPEEGPELHTGSLNRPKPACPDCRFKLLLS